MCFAVRACYCQVCGRRGVSGRTPYSAPGEKPGYFPISKEIRNRLSIPSPVKEGVSVPNAWDDPKPPNYRKTPASKNKQKSPQPSCDMAHIVRVLVSVYRGRCEIGDGMVCDVVSFFFR